MALGCVGDRESAKAKASECANANASADDEPETETETATATADDEIEDGERVEIGSVNVESVNAVSDA